MPHRDSFIINETNKHPLDSGAPCLKHDCQKCCFETGMPLTSSDIERIMNLGYRFRVFAVKKGEKRYLKNSAGKCVFLKDKGCKIYNFRPDGCRLYPLVFDVSSGKAFIDDFCPYGCEFQYNKEEVNKLKNLLKSL